jgi:hypothetical protein
MILSPAILALVAGSILVSMMVVAASWFGLQIVTSWDPGSGSERQLKMEKRTYLISNLMVYAFIFEILSFFLFIYSVDDLHRMFIGAMCAAGTLNVNEYGYLTLMIKMVVFILAGLWLIMNHADNKARDYPLIRKKYDYLLLLAPLVLVEASLQWAYFFNLKENVITSCCGIIFSAGPQQTEGPLSIIMNLPIGPLQIAFYGTALLSMGLGVLFYRGFYRLGTFFSISSMAFFLTSIAALISFISLYIYELPTHHCPFCILQREYHHVGYLLYGTLLGGVISGAGVGILMPYRGISSLQKSLPSLQKRLAMLNIILTFIFTALVTWQIIQSNLILGR